MSDDTNLQCSACVYQNYPCMGRFCKLGVKLWLEWKADKMTKWKPKVGEAYFIPYLMFFEADCVHRVWDGDSIEENWYKSGFVCRTKEEALELARKMLAVAKERVKNVE